MLDDLLRLLRDPEDPLLSDPLHQLLGNAICDAAFQELLLTQPGKAARQYGLTGNDLKAAAGVRGAQSIAEYAVKLEQRYAGIMHPGRVAVRRRKKQASQTARKAS
jgi:hypothetical protein